MVKCISKTKRFRTNQPYIFSHIFLPRDHTTQSLQANYFKPAEKVAVLAHPAKAEGVGIVPLIFSSHQLEATGQLHAPAVYLWVKTRLYSFNRRPGVDLNDLEKRQSLAPTWN
jgi:hypothetical protein